MTEPPSEGGEGESTREERLRALKEEFAGKLGASKGAELFRQLQEATLRRVGKDSSINVLDPGDAGEVVGKLWSSGLAGISAGELVQIDDALSRTIHKRRLILRFMKYYVQPEEFAAIDTSFQLIAVLRDRSDRSPQRLRLIRAFYDRIGRLKYGNRILNQVSVGWLESVTFPQMRALEARLAPAGRAHGPEAEAIRQIFYRSLEPESSRMWVRTSDDPTEIFGEIAYRLLGGGPRIPYLDVYAAAAAKRVRESAIDDFLGSYRQFETERVDLGPAGDFVRIRRRAYGAPS